MKKGATWIDRTLIISPFYLGLCCNKEQFENEMKRMKLPARDWPVWVPEGKDGCVHEFFSGNKKSLIMCIKLNKSLALSELMGLVVHESKHCWQRIIEELGEEKPSSEFECYSIQTLSQNFLEAIGTKKIK